MGSANPYEDLLGLNKNPPPEPTQTEYRYENPVLETIRLITTKAKTDQYPHIWGTAPFVETFLLAWTLVGLALFVRLCLVVKIKRDKI